METQSDAVVPQQSITNTMQTHAIYSSQEKPQKSAEFFGCYNESLIIATAMSSCITQKINIVRSELEEKQNEMNRKKKEQNSSTVVSEGDQRRLYHLQERCTALREKIKKLKVEQ